MKPNFKVIRAERIELTDERGETRAALECEKGRVRLRLLDGQGITRIALSVDQDGKIELAGLN